MINDLLLHREILIINSLMTKISLLPLSMFFTLNAYLRYDLTYTNVILATDWYRLSCDDSIDYIMLVIRF